MTNPFSFQASTQSQSSTCNMANPFLSPRLHILTILALIAGQLLREILHDLALNVPVVVEILNPTPIANADDPRCEGLWSQHAKTNHTVPTPEQYLKVSTGEATMNTSMPYEFVETGCSGLLPHGMQQLFAAFSWARRMETPTIVFPFKKLYYRTPKPFYQGFVDTMPLFNITVVESVEPSQPTLNRRMKCQNQGFYMQGDDAQVLSHTILAHSSPQVLQEQAERRAARVPRVGILNRNLTRGMINAQNVIDYLNTSSHGLYTITESPVYFERATFLEQVEFYANHDIVLTPHGAQITGSAFMPKCGQLFEIFPHGYLDPNYFGTLAKASGIQHYYAYLSPDQNETHFPKRAWPNTIDKRKEARDVQLCVNRIMMLNAVLEMVQEWKECVAREGV